MQKTDLNRELLFAEGYFDGAACVNVLYSTGDPLFTLSQIGRVLKDGGRLVLVTPPSRPRMTPFFTDHARAFKKKYRMVWPLAYAVDMLCMLPFMPLFLLINLFIKTNEDFHFFERDELQELARKAGFEVERLEKTYAGQGWLLAGKKIVSAGYSITR